MTSKRDSEILTRVGPGTAMGELMRQFWIPAAKSEELVADGDPMRLMLLGEKLIAFRDTSGRVGVFDHHCPHRCASLFFGRNEENGIRCVYHGWKYDVDGNCVDMANVPPHQDFKHKVNAKAYKAIESNGLIWVFMGNQENAPPLPAFEALTEPTVDVSITFIQSECKYLQALEGDVDTSHLSFLHFGKVGQGVQPKDDPHRHVIVNKAPDYIVQGTDYGVMYGAYRPAEDGAGVSWRIAHFLAPFWTMPPIGHFETNMMVRAWVPMDDETTMFVGVVKKGHGPPKRLMGTLDQNNSVEFSDILPATTDWHGRFRSASNIGNDFLIDREAQRTESFSGIKGIHTQDLAVTESMGRITDHSWEHLAPSDHMIAETRKFLVRAARAYQKDGSLPASAAEPSLTARERGGNYVEPEGADWMKFYRARVASISQAAQKADAAE